MSSQAVTGAIKRPKKIFLFSGPRTASNLLMRLLSKQEQFDESEYYFFGARSAINQDIDTHPNTKVSEDLRNRALTDVQNAFNKLQKSVDQSESQGKVPFIKEHVVMLSNPSIDNPTSYQCDHSFWTPTMAGETEPRPSSNPTILPDDFLKEWSAVFIIRHPALVLPSLLRTLAKLGTGMERAMFERHTSVTSQPQRGLYDWCISHQSLRGENPAACVIEADDVMNSRAVVEKMCALVGFDASKLEYQWEAKTGEAFGSLHPIDKIFKGTLIESRGVVKGKDSKGLDLTVEREKWAVEFGEDMASLLARAVEDAMEEDLYLWERRLRAD